MKNFTKHLGLTILSVVVVFLLIIWTAPALVKEEAFAEELLAAY